MLGQRPQTNKHIPSIQISQFFFLYFGDIPYKFVCKILVTSLKTTDKNVLTIGIFYWIQIFFPSHYGSSYLNDEAVTHRTHASLIRAN